MGEVFVMNQIMISIVIPVYNAEKYISQCINSVLNQTYLDFEVLCIDDGSKDGSAKIVESLTKKDNRIKLFTQPNQGAGKARNHGIQKARGKYLAFLDADDYYLDVNALEKMVTLCEEKKVPVCGSLLKRLENGKEIEEPLFQHLKEELYEKKVYQNIEFQLDYNYINFIFDREMILKNKIVFPDYRRFQDPPFMVKAMYHAKQFVVADTYLYCYRRPEMTARFTPEKVFDLLKGLIDNLEFAKQHNLDKLFIRTKNRLEYEYGGMIYHNISKKSIEILKLLLKANEIISEKLEEEAYIIRPLQMMIEKVEEGNRNYEIDLLTKIKTQDKIALYGAGKYARVFLKYLKGHGLLEKVSQIVVTSLNGNEKLEGIPLIAVSEFSDRDTLLLVTLGGHFYPDIEETLLREEINNYQFVDDVFLSRLA